MIYHASQPIFHWNLPALSGRLLDFELNLPLSCIFHKISRFLSRHFFCFSARVFNPTSRFLFLYGCPKITFSHCCVDLVVVVYNILALLIHLPLSYFFPLISQTLFPLVLFRGFVFVRPAISTGLSPVGIMSSGVG